MSGERVPILLAGTEELCLSLSQHQLAQFERYLEVLIDWSRRVSLTAVKDAEGIQGRHFLESAAIVSILRRHNISLEGRSLVDIGSGSGVPGIPLKILLPDLQLTLVEAKQRKSEFLTTLLEELEIGDVEVVPKRAEEAGRDESYREAFDFAAAKALAPMRTLLELTIPFVRMGGMVIAPKGRGAEAEARDATGALRMLHGTVRAIEPIPLAQEEQYVVLVDKELPTPDTYPRRPGMPAKRPL